jgi:hypothetical protein
MIPVPQRNGIGLTVTVTSGIVKAESPACVEWICQNTTDTTDTTNTTDTTDTTDTTETLA